MTLFHAPTFTDGLDDDFFYSSISFLRLFNKSKYSYSISLIVQTSIVLFLSFFLLSVCKLVIKYHILDCLIRILLSIMDTGGGDKLNTDSDLYLPQTDSFWEVCSLKSKNLELYFMIDWEI